MSRTGRVLVLGNAGFDVGLGLPRLPLPGETLLGEGTGRAPGGKGLNQALAAARAGAEVRFAAPLGADAEGDALVAALAGEGLHFAPHRLPAPTDFSLLMVLPGGESSIVSAGACARALTAEAAAGIAQAAEPGDVLLLQGNLSAAATAAALAEGRRRGATTVLNPAPLWWDPLPVLGLCDLVVVNRVEARAVTGRADPAEAAAALRAAAAARVVVTLGAEGCLALAEEGTRRHPAPPVEALDTTGCGDALCGVLAALLAAGRSLEAALAPAQRAAALTATRSGASRALPSRAELAAIFSQDDAR